MQYDAIIVGGGWAGLACSVTLALSGKNILLFEAAPQLGGRARSIVFQNTLVDNGQHLCMGAYQNTLALMQTIGLNTTDFFHQTPLSFHSLELHSGKKKYFKTLGNYSPPWCHFFGFLKSNLFSVKEKYYFIRLFRTLEKFNFLIPQDCYLLDFLKSHHQSVNSIQAFWEPISVAILSTSIQIASTEIFLTVLKEIFYLPQSYSHLLYPSSDLSRLLPNPIEDLLAEKSQSVFKNTRITGLIFQENNCIGVRSAQNAYFAKQIILALPPFSAEKLLPENNHFFSLKKQLLKFTYETILTVYFWFEKPVPLKGKMLYLQNSFSQWIFHREFANQPNLLAVVISGVKLACDFSKANLIKLVENELYCALPQLKNNSLINSKLIQEKKAAFSATPEVQALRKKLTLQVENVHFIGDYTDTNYPACLEGAVRSGVKLAKMLT